MVQFMTDVFHPLISQQDGTFNLAPKFRPWRCVSSYVPVLAVLFRSRRLTDWWGICLLCRPKEHHVYDILHVIKASFKKQALDEIKEHDCLNKEAYRYVLLPTIAVPVHVNS